MLKFGRQRCRPRPNLRASAAHGLAYLPGMPTAHAFAAFRALRAFNAVGRDDHARRRDVLNRLREDAGIPELGAAAVRARTHRHLDLAVLDLRSSPSRVAATIRLTVALAPRVRVRLHRFAICRFVAPSPSWLTLLLALSPGFLLTFRNGAACRIAAASLSSSSSTRRDSRATWFNAVRLSSRARRSFLRSWRTSARKRSFSFNSVRTGRGLGMAKSEKQTILHQYQHYPHLRHSPIPEKHDTRALNRYVRGNALCCCGSTARIHTFKVYDGATLRWGQEWRYDMSGATLTERRLHQTATPRRRLRV